MKKFFVFTILIASLALTGCAVKKSVDVGKDNQNKNTENTANENTQIANPASTYCIEQGGKLEIVETEAGQAGICKFGDGSECNEWAFFRKECKAGDKTAEVAETVDTSNWQTYQDKEYGFEMKYPKGWLVNKTDKSAKELGLNIDRRIKNVSFEKNNYILYFSYSRKEENIKPTLETAAPVGDRQKAGEIKIGNQKFIVNYIIDNNKVQEVSYIDSNFNDDFSIDGWFVEKEKKINNDYEIDMNMVKIANGILSSFKLTNNTSEVNLDISKWKAYTNKKLGFEIKYPSTFQYSENNEARSGVSFSGQGYNLIIYKPFPAIGFEPWGPVYKKAIKTNDPNTNLFYLYMKANENIGYEGTKDVIHIFWQKGETDYKKYSEKKDNLETDPNNNGLMTFDNVDNTDLLDKILSTFKFTN